MWVTQVLSVAALTFGAASGHVTAENATDGTATEGGADLCSRLQFHQKL